MENQEHHVKMINILYKYEVANSIILVSPFIPTYLKSKYADYLVWKTQVKHKRFRSMFAEASTAFYQERY